MLMEMMILAKAAGAELPHAFDAGWKGEATCETLTDNADVRAGRCAFPPGVGHERHFHNAHWGYVVAGGKMRITDENGVREQEFPNGLSWWSDGVAWHEAVNIGDTTAIYVIIEPKNVQPKDFDPMDAAAASEPSE